MAVKNSEINNSLWSGCDQRSGGTHASQYKDYVLVRLLVKYVSDKYAGDRDALIEVPPCGNIVLFQREQSQKCH